MLNTAHGKRVSEVKNVGSPTHFPVESLQLFPVLTPTLLPAAGRNGHLYLRSQEQDLGGSSSTQTHLGVPGMRLHRSDMADLRVPWSHAGLRPVPAHLGTPSAP